MNFKWGFRPCAIASKKLRRLSARFRNACTHNKEELYTLTPNPTIRSNLYYVKCLKKFIRARAVKNIALSGDYGSGKSSVVGLFQRSLFSKVRKTKLISLLTLSEVYEKKEGTNDAGKNELDIRNNIRKNIQREIFRQLYYSERPGSLCLSRYSRIGKFPILIYGLLIISVSIIIGIAIEQLDIDILAIRTDTFLIMLLTCLILAITVRLLASRIERFIQNISAMNIGAGGFSLDLAKKGPDFEAAADEFIYYFKRLVAE